VNVLFTVTDKKGRFITDLTKDDFAVAENKKPQIIQEFTAETDLPLRIAILIDTSTASATGSSSSRRRRSSSSTASSGPGRTRRCWSASIPPPSWWPT